MPDWASEGLLDDVEGEDAREARAALLDRLYGDGVPIDELRTAAAEQRLVLLPAERLVQGGGEHTAEEVATQAEVDLDLVHRSRRALGVPVPAPDEREFADEDIEWARQGKALMDLGVPEEDVLEVLRVLGRGVSTYVEAVTRLIGQALIRPGDAEDDLAARWAEATEQLLPFNDAWMRRAMALHLRHHLRAEAISIEERLTGRLTDTVETGVAFVDLVDFTALGEAVPVEELGSVAGRLGTVVSDALQAPVRLVKVIGDAAMLVSPAPDPLVRVVLDVLDAVDADDELPPVRGGVAFGNAVNRWGDVYGAAVNRASRLCSRARPSAVLVDEPVHEALDGDFQWSYAGEKRLKGIKAPVKTWRVRREA